MPTRPFGVEHEPRRSRGRVLLAGSGVDDARLVEPAVGLEQPFVAVLAGVVVRAGDEVEAHRLHVGRHLRHAGEPAGARALEHAAVDDVAFVVAGRDIGVANQLQHALESGIGIRALRIRDDGVADRRDREPVGDARGELTLGQPMAPVAARRRAALRGGWTPSPAAAGSMAADRREYEDEGLASWSRSP